MAYNSTVLCEVLRAIRRMLPAIVTQLVILLKDTSLGFVIGYAELLRSGRTLVEFYGNRYALQGPQHPGPDPAPLLGSIR
ncbi:hypothetical protein ACWD4G_43320 [Streptomyces sp. NPDC002643]